MGFKIHERLLSHDFLLVLSEKIDHPLEVGWHWLVQLSSHQNADGRQDGDLLFREVPQAQSGDVSVKDVGSKEECFDFVLLLFMEVDEDLHSISTLIGIHHLI